MKCISKHLKKLQEEKLIAKEDGEGGATAGGGGDGGVVAPADGGAVSDTSDVVSPDTKPHATGLSTTDILGKCDHRKDGVFGPGCFHLPCVWSIPCYRLPRKKRKKLKYANVVNEEDEYNLFSKDVKYVIQREIDEAQKWLDRIDPEISLEYTEDYDFDGEKADWVAALDQENQDNIKTFTVAFNLKALYDFLYDQGLEMDDTEINLQVKVSLWHEIGHALINYFRDMEIYDFEVSGVEEEKLVEEFAKYHIKKYTGVYKSKLNDFINEIFSKQETNKEEEVSETKGDVLTDFKQPINLANKKRFLGKNDAPLQGKKFVVSDIVIPGNAHLFANQNDKDVVAAINRHGMLCLQVEAQPEDEDEQDFLKLSVEDRKRFVDIILNIQKYLDDPKDDFELDVAAEFENTPEEDRKRLADRYSMLIGGTRQIWYRPTLLDVIRICHIGGVASLPLELLAKLDEHDHSHQKRYIESDQLNESVMDHTFVKDMYRLQSTKSHFAPERWTLLTNDYKTDTDLGYDVYTIRLQKENGIGTNYIFSTGVLFGYNESDTRLQTVYYIEPCEVIYMLQKGDVLNGDKKNVSMRLLWKCFQNLVEKKAFAGHSDRREGYH